MFCVPAAVASSVVACRSFVSLANFLHDDVYIYSTTARRNTRRPGGDTSGGDVTHVCASHGGCASDSSVTKTTRSAGNIPVRIDIPRRTSAPATVDSKFRYDSGGAGEGGEVVVHVDMTVHHDDDV